MQKYKKNILLLILVTTIPTNLHAELYKYIDKNGKVSYTNVAPPSTAKQVVTSKEIVENPTDRAIRLRSEQIQREEAAELKKYQQEQKRILREQRRILKEEQELVARQNAMTKQQNNISPSNNNNLKSAYTLELNRLKSKQKSAEKRCREYGTKRCLPDARRRYEKKIKALEKDPQQYFYNQAQTNSRSNGRSQQHTIINGEWDTQGQHYTPAGGGNAWRSDGTFMQKAAGGYIDTKTGQFVPAN